MRRFLFSALLVPCLMTLSVTLSACNGSDNVDMSGGGDNNNNSSDSGQSSGGGNLGGAWKATAAVAQDGCGERISPVTQTFSVNDLGSSVEVNTGILTLSAPLEGDGFTLGFQESNGECNRSYTAKFSQMSSGTASVNFSVLSTCNGRTCEDKWSGTATRG